MCPTAWALCWKNLRPDECWLMWPRLGPGAWKCCTDKGIWADHRSLPELHQTRYPNAHVQTQRYVDLVRIGVENGKKVVVIFINCRLNEIIQSGYLKSAIRLNQTGKRRPEALGNNYISKTDSEVVWVAGTVKCNCQCKVQQANIRMTNNVNFR